MLYLGIIYQESVMKQRWINKFLNENIINFVEVDKGGRDAYTQKVDNLLFFLGTLPLNGFNFEYTYIENLICIPDGRMRQIILVSVNLSRSLHVLFRTNDFFSLLY